MSRTRYQVVARRLCSTLTFVILMLTYSTSAFAGTIVGWGGNTYGQVSGIPEGDDIVDISAGLYHGLALRRDGSIAAWGYDRSGVVSGTPTGSGFVKVIAGYFDSVALRQDGSLVNWGLLRTGAFIDLSLVGSGFHSVAAGNRTVYALRADGSIGSWGINQYSQISNTPTGTGFIQIAAGQTHAYALRANGSIAAWGRDHYGQVSSTPTGTGYIGIAAYLEGGIALRADGSVITWGQDGDFANLKRDTPTEFGFTSVAGSTGGHVFAIRPDRSLVSWGWNHVGQASQTPKNLPFTKVMGGFDFGIALTPDRAPVPEPGTAILGMIGSIAILARSRFARHRSRADTWI